MRTRGLFKGALMLVLGALLTYGLATALQQCAIAEAKSSEAPVAAASEHPRTDAEWSF